MSFDNNKLINFFCNRTCQGVYNIGNTCYASSFIHCLGHCMTFVYPILSTPKGEKSEVYNAMRDVYKDIWVSNKVVNPAAFLSVLAEKLDGILQIRRQNDVMEFIMLVLDLLNKEIGVALALRTPVKGLVGTQKLVDNMRCEWHNTHRLAYSDLCDTMYGQCIQQMKCKICGKIEHRSEVFCNLALSFKDGSDTIDDLVRDYFEQELIKQNCESCNLHNVAAFKVPRLWKLSQVLIVQLKRFNSDNSKVINKITLGATLDVDEYVIIKPKDSTCTYELVAIACHAGGTNMGHYFSVVKNPNGTWYLMDDEAPPKKLESWTDIDSKNYYVLFYELMAKE